MGAKLYTFSGRFHKICDKITLNEKKTSIKGAILSIEALKTMPAGRVAHGFQIKMDSKTRQHSKRCRRIPITFEECWTKLLFPSLNKFQDR